MKKLLHIKFLPLWIVAFFVLYTLTNTTIFLFMAQEDNQQKPKFEFNQLLFPHKAEQATAEKDTNPYKDTTDSAQEIQGDDILNDIWNSMVQISKKSPYKEFTPAVLLGITGAESNYYPNSWIPRSDIPPKYVKTKQYSIWTWGYKESLMWQQESGFLNKSNTGALGPMQVEPSSYNSDLTYVSKHGSVEDVTNYGAWVASNPKDYDASGDGVADPFNYVDAMYYNVIRYGQDSQQWFPKYKFVSDKYKTDMQIMIYNMGYVGGQSTAGLVTPDRNESDNPMLQLFRKAIEARYADNGRYKEFEDAFGSLTGADPYCPACNQAVINFYIDNGWAVNFNGNSVVNVSYDLAQIGSTGVSTIRWDAARYPIQAYWSGPIAEKKIVEILKAATPNTSH